MLLRFLFASRALDCNFEGEVIWQGEIEYALFNANQFLIETFYLDVAEVNPATWVMAL